MRAVRLLLDTHVFLWWRADDKRLRAAVRKAIAEAEIVFVSAASAWEAAIKARLGRLDIPEPFETGVLASGFARLPIDFAHAERVALGRLQIPDTVEAGVIDSGFEKLPINFSHAEDAARLPPHHNDPFDRMLIAQAAAEGLTLVTHDRRLQPYDIEIMWP